MSKTMEFFEQKENEFNDFNFDIIEEVQIIDFVKLFTIWDKDIKDNNKLELVTYSTDNEQHHINIRVVLDKDGNMKDFQRFHGYFDYCDGTKDIHIDLGCMILNEIFSSNVITETSQVNQDDFWKYDREITVGNLIYCKEKSEKFKEVKNGCNYRYSVFVPFSVELKEHAEIKEI